MLGKYCTPLLDPRCLWKVENNHCDDKFLDDDDDERKSNLNVTLVDGPDHPAVEQTGRQGWVQKPNQSVF